MDTHADLTQKEYKSASILEYYNSMLENFSFGEKIWSILPTRNIETVPTKMQTTHVLSYIRHVLIEDSA